MQRFYHVTTVVILLICVLAATRQTSQAQTFRIVTVNTLSGAVTGSSLGGATIALQNKSEINYRPLRVGVGMGTIMGLGIGFYDLAKMGGNSGFYVHGTINTANTSGTIIMLDTFYGAATGAVVGAAVSLMIDSPIVNGLQYGSGVGSWVGFTFGLFDAFVLSSPGNYDSFYDSYSSNNSTGSTGFFEIRGDDNSYSVGFLNPLIFNSQSVIHQGGLTANTHMGVEVTRINIRL